MPKKAKAKVQKEDIELGSAEFENKRYFAIKIIGNPEPECDVLGLYDEEGLIVAFTPEEMVDLTRLFVAVMGNPFEQMMRLITDDSGS